METAKHPRTIYMIGMTSVIFVIVAGVTIGAALMMVEEDRGFLFWFTVGFLLFVELAIYAFALDGLTAKMRTTQTSTPALVASWGVLVIYGLIGLISIIIYSLVRDAEDPADKFFAAIMMIETAIAFVLVLATRSWDIFFQAGQAAVAEKREEHRAKSVSLKTVLIQLASVQRADPEQGIRLDKITKRLEGVEATLTHSHGGGVGSREGGRTAAIDPAIEGQLDSALLQLEGAVVGISSGDNQEQRLSEIEALTARLQGFISALQLD